jgi:hypothetical protein
MDIDPFGFFVHTTFAAMRRFSVAWQQHGKMPVVWYSCVCADTDGLAELINYRSGVSHIDVISGCHLARRMVRIDGEITASNSGIPTIETK